MPEENPTVVIYFTLGFICVIGGVANFVVYQRASEIGIDLLLIIPGAVCLVGGYYTLSMESRSRINDLFVKLRIRKEKLVACVDCSSYVGQYETSVTYVGVRRVVRHEPRFSEGICMDRGLLIHDGFHLRRCFYFRERGRQAA